MNYEEFRKKWLDNHPLAIGLMDEEDKYNALHEQTIKIYWLEYCNERSISLEKDFCDTLYDNLSQTWARNARSGDGMRLEKLALFFSAVGYENAEPLLHSIGWG